MICGWQGAAEERIDPFPSLEPRHGVPVSHRLSDEQRAELRSLVGAGVAPARTLTRARILLKADHSEAGPAWSDAAIAGALDVNPSTVLRVRRQFLEQGLAATLARKRPDRLYDRRLDGEAEATWLPSPAVRHRTACPLVVAVIGRRAGAARSGGDDLHQTVRQALKKTS